MPRRRPQDLVVAFTGSGATGAKIRALPNVIEQSVRVNVEADSLNAAILGPDAEPGSETYDYYLKDVLRDITQKAGQKCTAIRRILVPAAVADRVREDLIARLKELSPGPGTVLPHLVHGGPGRAGGGEELGGPHGLGFYLQRVALEGSRPVVEKIAGVKSPA